MIEWSHGKIRKKLQEGESLTFSWWEIMTHLVGIKDNISGS